MSPFLFPCKHLFLPLDKWCCTLMNLSNASDLIVSINYDLEMGSAGKAGNLFFSFSTAWITFLSGHMNPVFSEFIIYWHYQMVMENSHALKNNVHNIPLLNMEWCLKNLHFQPSSHICTIVDGSGCLSNLSKSTNRVDSEGAIISWANLYFGTKKSSESRVTKLKTFEFSNVPQANGHPIL